MSRWSVTVLLAVLMGCPSIVQSQNEPKPRSQQDIIRDRERACKGLKGQAMNDCQASYVGTREEKSGNSGWRRPPNPSKRPGRE
jgi:hypothetical protein